MSRIGAAPRAAVPMSSARAEASRKNGAKSRGPKTEEGRARSSQNALKHGLRAEKHVVLPDEDAAEFAGLEAALIEELAPVGVLQAVLARRVAVAAWRLARADRIETELFEERRWAEGGLGLALIRDGNGTRSFETLLRYRSAAMAEFWRALKTLKALRAEQAVAPRSRTGGAPPGGEARDPGRPANPRPSSATGRTRARRGAPAGLRHARATDRRPHPFTKHRPRGRRTNPTGRARARCTPKGTQRSRTNPSRTRNLHLG